MQFARRTLLALGLVGSLATVAPVSALDATIAPKVVALEAPVPSWYTPELDAQVKAAGTRGVPLPAGAEQDIPKSGLAFTGIRPGSWILSPAGCTTNFVFQSTAGAFNPNQTLYIGTAGHCASTGQQVTLVAVAPNTNQRVLVNIGSVVKSTGDTGDPGNDFALIQINSGFNSWVSPSMTHWGGPTSPYLSNSITAVVHSGHGLVLGTGGTPRGGVLLAKSGTARYWDGPTIFGDSGSALNTATGQAVSNITHLVVFGPNFTVSAGTDIQKIQQIAAKPLSVCPTRTPWPLPGCPTV